MKSLKAHIFPKAKHGWYQEPGWVSRRLFDVENFDGVIWDPACGVGTILDQATAAGYNVLGSDIINRRRSIGFERTDFLKTKGPDLRRPFSIISNPPFDYVEEFCRHAIEVGARKVAMLCLLRRLPAAHWLHELPLKTVHLLTPRPSMPPGEWIKAGNKPGGGTQDFCWLVFLSKLSNGTTPTLRWLHRDGKDKA